MSQSLNEILNYAAKLGLLNKEVSIQITGSLAGGMRLRPYQNKALKRWIYYIEDFPERPSNPHVLFHMATGSGKTVLMAALILDLYRRGYRNFLFFVNSAQIIEKTKENFLNPASAKHLFAANIHMNDKPVEVRSVETFDATSDDAINIHFTTIQGLHSRMQAPKENSVTMEDFRDYKVVMISDEAHHLNAKTKATLFEDEPSWEGTVLEIFSQHPENMLLEFTATLDLEHPAIKEKYEDKLLFDYSLREFRADRYSKDIGLRRASVTPEQRMMQAMVLSQYRRKVAEAHGLHCKPVILMKSKTIKASAENEAIFAAMVEELDAEDLDHLQAASFDDCTLSKAFKYIFQDRGISSEEFGRELRSDFAPEKVVNVNNLKDLEKRQIELNALEDRDNEIRVIFAVDKLNEGWDVLNLFDIVRLYDTRDGRENKVGRTTMAEAQLIGRGARYFPFNDPDDGDAEREKRKYDKSLDHPLRILEELHYHCAHNPKYIQDIKNALCETGMYDEDARIVELHLKESFKATDVFEKALVYLNSRVRSNREGVFGLASYQIENYFNFPTLLSGQVIESSAFGEDRNFQLTARTEPKSRTFMLSEFGHPVLRFASDGIAFFHFTNLQRYFPNLSGMRQFFDDPDYLGSTKVMVRGPVETLDNLSPKQKVEITRYVLRQIEAGTKNEAVEFEGSKEFKAEPLKNLFVDKRIKVRPEGETGRSWSESNIQDLHQIDLSSKEWHVYDDSFGTDQEKLFIQYLNDQSDRLKAIYDDFFLLRNEKAFKLFAFKDGRALEPDFLLILRKQNDDATSVVQIFIEPKGEHLAHADAWKQQFLKELNDRAELEIIAQNSKYRVFGAPFFNAEPGKMSNFDNDFQKIIGVLGVNASAD